MSKTIGLIDDEVVAGPEKQPAPKTFKAMNAGEQIAFIANIEVIEDLEALKEFAKATALTAIETKIDELNAGD